jgi:hypothetical protein
MLANIRMTIKIEKINLEFKKTSLEFIEREINSVF